MRGPTVFAHTAGVAYLPSYDGSTHYFKVTTAVATAQRLGTLLTVPKLIDETYRSSAQSQTGVSTETVRPPLHMFVQVPLAAANSVYMTDDNVTTPIVGGPGQELEPGTIYRFENAGMALLRGGYQMNSADGTARYQVNALTAYQFIAAAATVLLIWFKD